MRGIKWSCCNVVRIPFNYRHFESDAQPFEYDSDEFRRLDQLIRWARAYDLSVILAGDLPVDWAQVAARLNDAVYQCISSRPLTQLPFQNSLNSGSLARS